ncbi:MAG TPA: hypothetical protein VIQ00_01375 [Chitinophagaceae bacterium]|jgi:hypothetical protein
MKHKTSTSIGALHPILFFAGVYVVALFLSIFICSTIFYSLNDNQATVSKQEKAIKTHAEMNVPATGVAVR